MAYAASASAATAGATPSGSATGSIAGSLTGSISGSAIASAQRGPSIAASTSGVLAASTGPWWRHPMMWLVVGGPSLVVVASFITLTLAIRHADPVVEHGNQAGSAHVSAEDAGTEQGARTAAAGQAGHDPALQPAMRARNHAATGGKEH